MIRRRGNFAAWWPWLLVALAIHAAVLVVLEKNLRQNAEYDVAAGESGTEVDLAVAPEPPVPEPPKPVVPAPAQTPPPLPPKPDEMALPTPVACVTPTPVPRPAARPAVTEKSRAVPHATPVRVVHPSQGVVSGQTGRAGARSNAKPGYLQNPAPPYPESAREDQEQGVVQLMVSVDEAGRVLSICLIRSSGYPDLDQSAMRTVRMQWRFTPARVGGIAVSSDLVVPIRFKLSD